MFQIFISALRYGTQEGSKRDASSGGVQGKFPDQRDSVSDLYFNCIYIDAEILILQIY